MLSLIISDLKRRWNCLNRPTMRELTLSLLVALCVPSLYAQRASIRAGNGLKEARGDTLRFHLDTLKVRNEISDSLDKIPRTGSVSSGRTYLRGPYVDSTDALYSVNLVQDFTAQANFSNGTSGGDSTQLVFGGSTGLLLPVTAGRRLTFELAQIKTNYTGGGGSYVNTTLPAHVFSSADTAYFSVHFIAVGTSPRRYWLRLYKSKQADISALAPNLADAVKVFVFQTELDPLTVGYFPPTTTSFQFRFTLRAKWTP